MKSIKPGRGPSALGAIGSASAIIIGIFWTIAAYSMTRDSPFPMVGVLFPLFGILFIVIGCVQLVFNIKNTTSKNRFSLIDITENESDPLEEKYGKKEIKKTDTTESRLLELKDLKDKGLISDMEFESKRNRIIQDL